MTKLRFDLWMLLAVFAISTAQAEDWEHWRGPRRNDSTSETSGWSSESQWPGETIWEVNVGEGSSSPIVHDDRVYVMGWQDGRDHLFCLSANTGAPHWRISYEARQYGRHATGDEGLYSGVTSTPELDAATRLIYTLGVDGELNCWDTRRKGAQVWGFNLYDRFAIEQRPRIGRAGLRDYGFTTAPLLHGNVLIVEVGDDEGNLMGFDKRTGRRVWVSESKDRAGHSGGPVPMLVEGVPCLATFTLRHLLITRLDDSHAGKTIAEYPWETDFSQNIATPAVHENTVLITSAYNHQTICKLAVTLQGARKVWEAPFSSGICTPVVHRGHIYWSSNSLHCLDFASGEQVWEGGSFGDAGSCIVTADERLIVFGKQGTLALVDTAGRSPREYHELARTDDMFAADVWPHVALAGRSLLCKDRSGNLKCFRLPPGVDED